jgi:hypothetical protein
LCIYVAGPESVCGCCQYNSALVGVPARDVGLSDKAQIREWAEDHAEDSYFFLTRVRGQFPVQGALQFIPTDLVDAAMIRDIERLPTILWCWASTLQDMAMMLR